jgi:hypothetical protein
MLLAPLLGRAVAATAGELPDPFRRIDYHTLVDYVAKIFGFESMYI